MALRVALVVVAFAGPPAFGAVSRLLFGATPALTTRYALQLAYCALAFGFICAALRLERLPASALGIRRPTILTPVLAAALLAVSLVVLPLITSPLVQRLGADGLNAGVQQLAVLPLWLRVVVGMTGGAIEETLYRGYALGRLEALTGRPWLAAVLVIAGFTLAHVPFWGTVYTLVAVLPFGLMMTIAYVWRRDLIANIIAHSGALVVGLWGI